MRSRIQFLTLILLLLTTAPAQEAPRLEQIDKGEVTQNGRQILYRIRNLPISSYPEIPAPIAATLIARGCLVPQTYQAHHPENVIHGSFESSNSNDWAVLCSAADSVSLLVFFSSSTPDKPAVLATNLKTSRLQPGNVPDELGFNWGIDSASPHRVHEAQSDMSHRPPTPGHDSIADTTIDAKTIYHFYKDGQWEKLDTE